MTEQYLTAMLVVLATLASVFTSIMCVWAIRMVLKDFKEKADE